MNLVDICKLKYPGEIESGHITFRQPGASIIIDQWHVPNTPRPSEDAILAEAPLWQNAFNMNQFKEVGGNLVQTQIDFVAQARGYGDGLFCASYFNSTNVTWKAEATAFIAWRDAMFDYAIGVYQQIEQGGSVPTQDTFVGEFPVIAWPS